MQMMEGVYRAVVLWHQSDPKAQPQSSAHWSPTWACSRHTSIFQCNDNLNTFLPVSLQPWPMEQMPWPTSSVEASRWGKPILMRKKVKVQVVARYCSRVAKWLHLFLHDMLLWQMPTLSITTIASMVSISSGLSGCFGTVSRRS
ncbi:hypothetical protein F441_00232 [Phytophthora nicotianae CJ01A1]|uniref:Uncharacterized protein n=1 Tax=Phytophthora nicotianae CJ01A1 TaxID=1317063 RepID=W2XZ90_PHYNI|nr:hypothetical protein F441_00232 [Phytophthora nicotianae CJ01A1]